MRGHYYYESYRSCGQACGGGTQAWYIVNPMFGGYCDGWYYTGNGGCIANDGSGNCICEEDYCNTCQSASVKEPFASLWPAWSVVGREELS